MPDKSYPKEMQRWLKDTRAIDEWGISVWVRIGVEAVFWCSVISVLIWAGSSVSYSQVVPRRSLVLVVTSLLFFLLCGYLGSHISISIGRILSIALMWAAVLSAASWS